MKRTPVAGVLCRRSGTYHSSTGCWLTSRAVSKPAVSWSSFPSSPAFTPDHRCHNPSPRRAASARTVCVAAESLWYRRSNPGMTYENTNSSFKVSHCFSHRATSPALCSPELPLVFTSGRSALSSFATSVKHHAAFINCYRTGIVRCQRLTSSTRSAKLSRTLTLGRSRATCLTTSK